MKYINKQIRKNFFVTFFVTLFIFAIIVFVEADNLRIFFPTSNLAGLTPDSSVKDGSVSSARISAILDWVAEDDEGKYYLVPASENNYVFFYVYEEYDSRFQDIYDATWDYMVGDTDTIEARSKLALGPIWKVDSDDELIDWTVEWFEYYEFFEDDAVSHIVPYVMVYVPVIDLFGAQDWFFLIAGICCAVWFVCILIKYIAGGGKRALKKYMQENGITPEQFDSDIENGLKFKSAVLTRREIILLGGYKAKCYRGKDIVWAYVQHTETTHRTYGIKTGVSHSYSVMLNDRAGKKYQAVCKDEDEARSLLQELSARFPHVLIGAGELMNMAKNNYSQIVQASDERLYNGGGEMPPQDQY